ncbi:cytochrome P450 [Streptomyces sp. NPDC050416]|uniref:cytochrome P450 n=1 Tax=Streptomyces sp. NPDC050416 TaxID=3365611 RepID=UPI00378DDE3B
MEHAAAAARLVETLLGVEDQLGRRQVQDEAVTLLAGAIETTGTTLAWALYEIAGNPAVERRLREELASVCQDRPLRYDDIDQLPYARRVLQEAIRKYGPSWMVTRTAARDIVLGGHLIPEGADVVWSPYLHQHDSSFFPDPVLVSRVLGALMAHDAEHGTEYLHTFRVALRSNRSWRLAADELHIHKQTLGYRLRKIEQLTGRGVTQTDHIAELWFAVRAHDLVHSRGPVRG